MSRYKNSEKRKEALKEKERSASWENITKVTLSQHNQKKKSVKVNTRKLTTNILLLKLKTIIVDFPQPMRPLEKWVAKSYNEDKQIIDFIHYGYCKYKPPVFMFSLFKEEDTKRLYGDYNLYKNWFFAIARGESFYKKASNIFSKREAHIFLSLNNNNTIEENVWLAKCMAYELSKPLSNVIIKKLISSYYFKHNKFWDSFLHFVKKFEKDATAPMVEDIIDFLINTLRGNPTFSLKNRTLNSVVALSNVWHRQQQILKHHKENYALASSTIPNFKWEDESNNIVWEINQIKTINALYKEGAKMHHCVGSYGYKCVKGESFIFSATKDDGINSKESVLTIEVVNNRIVQARGKYNRVPTNQEMKVLKRWCATSDIKLVL